MRFAVQARRSSSGQVVTIRSRGTPSACDAGGAVVEEVQLAGRVGVGVDREQAPDLDRQRQQVVGRVLPLRTAVDLDRDVVVAARGEHRLGVELALRPGAPPAA